MRLKRDDFFGLGASLLVHLLLIAWMALAHMAAVEPPSLGYMEVEFGPFEEDGQEDEKEEPVEEPEEEEAPPQEPEIEPVPVTRHVNLPDLFLYDEDELDLPDPVEVAPEIEPVPVARHVNLPDLLLYDEDALDLPDPVEVAPEEPPQAKEEEGTADGSERSAPFDITGLENRNLIARPLPAYTDNVSAVIRMQITVDPSGRVTQVLPVMKGTPALERESARALRRWRFSALPTGAPRANQVGVVTLRFVIE